MAINDVGLRGILLFWIGLLATVAPAALGQPATGPLTVHPVNPRYFMDGLNKAVYLTGSHTWTSLQEEQAPGYSPTFDFNAYLDLLESHNHNYFRMWRLEMPRVRYAAGEPYRTTFPHPWARTGPGVAADGLAKFNLNIFDQSIFDRMRSRCIAAGDRGIYVSIMLFDGYEMHQTFEGWAFHPFNSANNVNGIHGDPDGNNQGTEINTLAIPAVTALQEAYVRKVIDTVNDLDNVIYEIANEAFGGSVAWQNHLISVIRNYQNTKPQQHPVLFTTPFANVGNALWESTAEAISPGTYTDNAAYRDNPPANNGSKIIINDTDHLWGCGGNTSWIWRSFTRGLNPIYMDSYYPDTPFCFPPDNGMRLNLGYARSYARRMNLGLSLPLNTLVSTQHCLARVGSTYLVYAPSGGNFTVNLSGAPGPLRYEWFNPGTGAATIPLTTNGGGTQQFTPPFGGQAVLFIYRRPGDTNSNGQVNIDDLVSVITAWGPCPSPLVSPCNADVNHTGLVDIDDLVQVLTNWG